jgi:serine/threonine protein kinase
MCAHLARSVDVAGASKPDDTNSDQTTRSVTQDDQPDKSACHYQVGEYMGKYQIKGLLGKGGMGVVYRGFDPLIEREVALKVLPPDLSSCSAALQRFIGEARAVGKLMHPNTVALYEVGQFDGAYYLAMEYMPGGSVAALLANEKRLPWQRATKYLLEICQGLSAAHRMGLIHRDIKPENLLRTMDDHLKITDFGLAKVLDQLVGPTLNLTKQGALLGTPLYMSPEQFSGSPVDGRSDLYSAGVTYFHLLTGRTPFVDAANLIELMYAHCHRAAPDPREFDPEIPEECAKLALRIMAKRPEDRFSSADDLCCAITATMVNAQTTRHSSAGSVPPAGFVEAAKPTDQSVQPLTHVPVVWVLEPSRMQASVLSRQLQSLGVGNVRLFATIADTIAAAMTETPTAIISAMHLDDGTGEDLAALLPSVPNGSSIYCFISSSDPQHAASGSVHPGRPLILPKPLTGETLVQALGRICPT